MQIFNFMNISTYTLNIFYEIKSAQKYLLGSDIQMLMKHNKLQEILPFWHNNGFLVKW